MSYRPRYPLGVLNLLREHGQLSPAHAIADIGSGTGFLAELFLKNGNAVFGVEPNKEMREAGEEYLAAYPRFTSINASAEATTLLDASVDFVTAGQAFHWFAPEATHREFPRILRPNGWVAVVWNDRSTSSTSFADAYEDLLHATAPTTLASKTPTRKRKTSARSLNTEISSPVKFPTTRSSISMDCAAASAAVPMPRPKATRISRP